MRCIYCGVDTKYKDRQPRGACGGCGKKFAFEPKRGDRFTDVGFKAAIDAVSAKGQVRWGVEHLYYEICRRKLRGRFKWANVLFFSVVWMIISYTAGATIGGLIVLLVAVGS